MLASPHGLLVRETPVKELIDILQAWERQRGESLALATLVRAQGSSYRRPGARMLICTDGSAVGSLSGGCLEEEVRVRAREVLTGGGPALMEFDTRRRFGCHGQIEILIETAPAEFLDGLCASFAKRSTCRAATVFAEGEMERGTRLLAESEPARAGAFVQEIAPPIQLVVFGHGPDSGPLRAFAETLGWSVVEIDEAASLPTRLDSRTAAIVKSHNYGRDFAALRHLLQFDLPYVGLLGPRRRREQLLGDLIDSGASVAAELFSPAGLDLGAETPEEIALSVIAEIQILFARASGEELRKRKEPIHGWNIAHHVDPCTTSAP